MKGVKEEIQYGKADRVQPPLNKRNVGLGDRRKWSEDGQTDAGSVIPGNGGKRDCAEKLLRLKYEDVFDDRGTASLRYQRRDSGKKASTAVLQNSLICITV